MLEVTPAHTRGPRHVREKRRFRIAVGSDFFRLLVEPGKISVRQVFERLVRLARQGKKPGPARLVSGVALRRAVAFHQQVRIRSRNAEGADPGGGRAIFSGRPGGRLRGDPHRQPVPFHVRVGALEVKLSGNNPVTHR